MNRLQFYCEEFHFIRKSILAVSSFGIIRVEMKLHRTAGLVVEWMIQSMVSFQPRTIWMRFGLHKRHPARHKHQPYNQIYLILSDQI